MKGLFVKFSPVPESVTEDGEFFAEILTQIARLMGYGTQKLPSFAKQTVEYILDGGKRPLAATPVQKSIVRAAKRTISELLTEYPHPVPPKVHERLK